MPFKGISDQATTSVLNERQTDLLTAHQLGLGELSAYGVLPVNILSFFASAVNSSNSILGLCSCCRWQPAQDSWL